MNIKLKHKYDDTGFCQQVYEIVDHEKESLNGLLMCRQEERENEYVWYTMSSSKYFDPEPQAPVRRNINLHLPDGTIITTGPMGHEAEVKKPVTKGQEHE